MARVKSVSAKKHRKILRLAKGFKNARHRRIRSANEAVLHAGQYAFVGRKLKKRNLKTLWILRLSAEAKKHDISYNNLIHNLKEAKIEIDRKILSEIAVSDENTFKSIIAEVKKN